MKIYQHIRGTEKTTINLERITHMTLHEATNSVTVCFGNDDSIGLIFDSSQEAAEHYQLLHDLMSE